MIVRAIFTGENGSLGYEAGKPYVLFFRVHDDHIVISRPHGNGKCLYESLKSFLDNWKVI